jgi:hypothetical protein
MKESDLEMVRLRARVLALEHFVSEVFQLAYEARGDSSTQVMQLPLKS